MIRSYFFLFTILISGCISQSDVLKKEPQNIQKFDPKNIEGKYYNHQTDSLKNGTLWDFLCRSENLKNPRFNSNKEMEIEIKFIDKNKISIVSYLDTLKVSEMTLEGYVTKEYFSLNRKLKIIPIPFFYWIHNEFVAFIANDINGNLVIKNGYQSSGTIFFFAADMKNFNSGVFRKIK